jgi:hypothetical protein
VREELTTVLQESESTASARLLNDMALVLDNAFSRSTQELMISAIRQGGSQIASAYKIRATFVLQQVVVGLSRVP